MSYCIICYMKKSEVFVKLSQASAFKDHPGKTAKIKKWAFLFNYVLYFIHILKLTGLY